MIRCGLDAGALPEALFVAAEGRGGREVERLVAEVSARGCRVFPLARGVAARVADTVTPHPLFAIFAMTDVSLDAVAGPSLAVACVDVRDPGNAGTVLRTCDAAGVDLVVCCGGTVDPFNPKTVRASAGSIFHVPIVVAPEVLPTLRWLHDAGLQVYGTDAHGSDYATTDLTVPSAFVLGNEAAGLPEALRGELDGMLGVPMVGRAESLNVGVTCAVLCFEALRQRRSEPRAL